MSEFKKDAQGRTIMQKLREWTDVPQKVREFGGPSEYRQSMKELRKLDSVMRDAARKMNRLLPKVRRSILLRRTDEAIDLLKKALEPTKDLKKTIEFITSGSVTSDAADDTNNAGIRNWYAETIGKGHDWLEKRKGKEGDAEKQRLLRGMYAKAEEFAKLFTDGLGRLGDYRSESDFDKYIELASFLADKRTELQSEVDTQLEQLSPAPVEVTKEAPPKEEESDLPEPPAEGEQDPVVTTTEAEQPTYYADFPDLPGYESETSMEAQMARQEQNPYDMLDDVRQALSDENQEANTNDGNKRVAAALLLKASQMFEDEGKEQESIKALALAERLLGIRRSGG